MVREAGGKPGWNGGLRGGSSIIYEIQDGLVVIVRVLHGRQNILDEL